MSNPPPNPAPNQFTPYIPPWMITQMPHLGSFPNGHQLPNFFDFLDMRNSGNVRVYAAPTCTRLLSERDNCFRQVTFGRNILGLTLDAHQLVFLSQDVNAPYRRVDVYGYFMLCLCRLPGNSFQFKTMKDLYFFLLHTERYGARDWIETIFVEDFTSGTHVTMACHLMRFLRPALMILVLDYCPYCCELRCKGKKWRALKQIHGFAERTRMTIAMRPRPAGPRQMCEECRKRNPVGQPRRYYGTVQQRAQRLAILRASLLRRA